MCFVLVHLFLYFAQFYGPDALVEIESYLEGDRINLHQY